MRVVLADDLTTFRMQLHRIVTKDLGHECVGSATNGLEALDLCRRMKPDVVILDLTMPVMTGQQAAKIIAAELPKTKIVIVSLNAQNAIIEELRALGATFCMKPYEPAKLRAVLKRIHVDA